MAKINIPFKAALGYGVVAMVMVIAIWLVYDNTQSILSINQASREYIQKRESADSTMAALLKDEQNNLRDLANAMKGKPSKNYLSKKMDDLNSGKDSIMVHPKTAKTHEAQNTTVEVVKTRKGFFHRLADAFKKERAETISVKRDSNHAIIDTITPVNVAENVADILEQINQKERTAAKHKEQNISKEMTELQMANAQLAIRSAQQLNQLHQKERASMQQTINKAMVARQHLLWQIGLLAGIAIIAAIILIWYIWRDTKKERIYRENLENANEEIQRIMEQRERLLLTITHDIKAPAASISGFIDLVREQSLDSKTTSYLNNIKNSATHLSQLVASLLDYHQLEKGQMQVHPVSFNPTQLAAQCTEEMRTLANVKGLQIIYDTKESRQDLYLADAFRIHQILSNLISNAIKYTQQGEIVISLSIQSTNEASSKRLILKVSDTGQGMTSEECRRIFHAFTRLKEAQGIEGTGLGLSITQELANLLGGSIRVESVKGKGSIFTVCLPIAQEAQQETSPSTASPEPAMRRTLFRTAKPFRNKKMLILDDDTLQLKLLQEMLHSITQGAWEVFVCQHVTEALTILHQEQPTLMMIDIEMPEMSGIDFITHINHSQMTVIGMTAHDESFTSQLKEAGFDGCLFKPFNKEDIQHILGIEPSIEEEKDDYRFSSILAFAENDPEAEKEILSQLKEEIHNYLKSLKEGIGNSQEGNDIALEAIGKVAHKLLPIATMLQLQCTEQIQSLSPEHIGELEDEKIREYTQSVIQELESTLGDIII